MRRLRRLPVRIRLAIVSAGLTFAILLLFAVVIGLFAGRQVRSEFDDELKVYAADLQQRLVQPTLNGPVIQNDPEAIEAAAAGRAAIRIVLANGHSAHTVGAPPLGAPHGTPHDVGSYRVVTREITGPSGQTVVGYLQYARPRSRLGHTLARIDLFLGVGVIAGTALAFLAGLALARRAMKPISNLTHAAQDIARTRDPAVSIPKPEAADEVADLAETLEEMLQALDAARTETEGALARQREFVADASHELRTPLTSILANLELLEEDLSGEDQEMARSALRSSRRMRRLVADLLLLARADAGRESTMHDTVNLARVVREAAVEAAPVAAGHDLTLDLPNGGATAGASPMLLGVADDLHRLALNLIENALAHTPPGTDVRARVRREGAEAVLQVDDAGPGIAPDMRPRIFDRFVRGSGERAGGGSGLGLAIVRAVTDRHGGSVEVGESELGGARFTVRLPALPAGTGVRPLRPPAAPSAGA